MMTMKIFAPIFAKEEVDPLARAGAEEFYCGIVPTEWRERYGFQICPNRREIARANLESYEELAAIVEQSHVRGITVHVTLNARYYTENMLQLIRPMLVRLQEVGVDAVIVADVGLLLLLRELDLGLAIDVSSVAMAYNEQSVAFFRDLGARRILFPRETTMEEIGEITKMFPDLEYESFMYVGGCFFAEAFCTTLHHQGRPFFCRMLLDDGNCIPLNDRRRAHDLAIAGNETLRSFSPRSLGGAPHVALEGTRPGCGLCSIRTLRQAGVGSLKLVGRAQVVEYRVYNIGLIREAIALAESDLDDETCIREIVRMQSTSMASEDPLSFEFQVQKCMLGSQCYYPDDARLVRLRRRYWENASGENSSIRFVGERRQSRCGVYDGAEPDADPAG
jgi:U32 family peptidase